MYAQYATAQPSKMKVVGVCEPRPIHRKRLASTHCIAADRVFDDWRPLLAMEKIADFAIVATQDRQHRDPAVALAGLGCT